MVDLDSAAILAAVLEVLPPEVPTRIDLVDGVIDLEVRCCQRAGDVHRLTEMEVGVLGYLAARPDTVVSNAEILEQVWGYEPGLKTRAAHNTIRRLRGKIEADPASPRHLVTEHGVGFQWVSASPSVAPPIPAPVAVPKGLLGRAEDCAWLEARVSDGSRLVTITGPGGVGKTRLLREVAPELGTTRFVDCASARDVDGLASTVAAALGVTLGGGDAVGGVSHALVGLGDLRLLLDNLEQVQPSAASAVSRWLGDAPNLVIVATSRAPLHLPQERLLPLDTLPTDGDAAAALFVQRAQAVHPAFEVEDPAVLREVIELLDGLPLAIELAAPRVRLLGLEQLRDRLWTDVGSLRTRRSDVDERHVSLQATLDWSWELLTDPQRDALVALSSFAGPFQAREAVQVLGGDELDAEELLEDLVDASLLAASDQAGWWRLLRSVAAWARQRGTDREDTVQAAAVRHARCFAEGASVGALLAIDRAQGAGFSRLRQRVIELELAFDRSLDAADLSTAAALLPAIATLRTRVGPYEPLRARVQRFWPLADPESRARSVAFPASPGVLATVGIDADDLADLPLPTDPTLLAMVRAQLGQLAHGRADLSEAESYYRSAAEQEDVAAAILADRASVARKQGDLDRAERLLLEAESWADRHDDRRLRASVCFQRALLCHGRGDVDAAVDHQRQGLDLSTTLRDGRLQQVAVTNLAILQQHQGQLAEAAAGFRDAVQEARRLGNLRSEAKAATNLGFIESMLGNREASRVASGQAARLADELDMGDTAARARLNLSVAWLEDDPDRALAVAREAEAILAETEDPEAALFADIVVGRALLATGDARGAVHRLQRAVERAQAAPHAEREAEGLAWLGYAEAAAGDEAAALESWTQARQVSLRHELSADLTQFVAALPIEVKPAEQPLVH